MKKNVIPSESESKENSKRLFIGLDVSVPWPNELPSKNVVDKLDRHITLVFLGEANFLEFKPLLENLPLPSFVLGPVAEIDECIFLPKKNPRLVAWHVHFLELQKELIIFQKDILAFLQKKGFCLQHRNDFLPHITLCRKSFNPQKWKNSFVKLPLVITSIHLYESLGFSKYNSLWKQDFILPFEEIEHTADIAFKVRGTNFENLKLHAFMAISFKFPPFLNYFSCLDKKVRTLDDIIILLNEIVSQIDIETGSPFKAVSFHAKLEEKKNYLEWEMIIDV